MSDDEIPAWMNDDGTIKEEIVERCEKIGATPMEYVEKMEQHTQDAVEIGDWKASMESRR